MLTRLDTASGGGDGSAGVEGGDDSGGVGDAGGYGWLRHCWAN